MQEKAFTSRLFFLGPEKLLHVREGKDLGIVISDKLTWDSHVHPITAKANKLLGLMKRACPLLTKLVVRRPLYFGIEGPHLCYTTEAWSAHGQYLANVHVTN